MGLETMFNGLEGFQAAMNTVEGKVALAIVMVLLAAIVTTGTEVAVTQSKEFFRPKAKLAVKDQLLLDMLDTQRHNFVITDPSLADNPIVYASDAFCRFTLYKSSEICGRNCRFLQGKDTLPSDITKIRDAVKNASEENVQLLNYKKDGSTFINQFFISPLRDAASAKTAYFVGIQHELQKPGPGQHPENVGWVYTFGSHQ